MRRCHVRGQQVVESAVSATRHGWATPDRCLWPAEPGQLAAIRAEVYRRLSWLGLSPETEHDLVLAVNEAATNAIEHGYRSGGAEAGVELAFWLGDGNLHIAVVDRGTWQEPAVGPTRRGLGLAMIRQLCSAVALDHDGDGTRIVLQHPLGQP